MIVTYDKMEISLFNYFSEFTSSKERHRSHHWYFQLEFHGN